MHDGKGCGWPAASNFEQGDFPDTHQPLRKFAYLLSTGIHTDFVRNFWLLFHQCIHLWENDDCFSRKQVRALIESTSGLFGLKAAGTVLDRAVRIAQWPPLFVAVCRQQCSWTSSLGVTLALLGMLFSELPQVTWPAGFLAK